MSLSSGTRLGPYELVAPVGAGGMGEVYRAKDTRLDRTVAVKVLPEHLSASAESRQRFEREAKTISQLSHPHICALYDVGNQDGVEFLVMEYLEGETLSDRLLKGALPFDQVLRYGIEIADALDKAHRQGIVHRDLKPGNVMITKSGVKLLDFGLAKAIAPTTPQQLTSFPTQQALTQEGTILGTFQYMAPEQLEGKDADARTDIFAFGTVLYEMATGQKAFSGRTQASLIAAIIERVPPPISTVSPMTPPAFDRVVKTCLEKDPEDRWQTAHDVRLELKWAAEGGSAAGLPAPVLARRKSRERLAWVLVAALLVVSVVLAGAARRFRQERGETRAIRSFILPSEKATFRFLHVGGPPVVSPDGRRLTYAASTPDRRSTLWVRPLDAVTEQPLAGTEGASFPFWSPDSRFIGFFAEGKLKKIEASGGPAVALCDARDGRGGTWNRDGVILFAKNYSPIYRVLASGGAPTEVTKLDASRGDRTHRWPLFLPDGRHFLYLASPFGSENEKNAVFAAALDGKENRLLLSASSNVAYASGYLLYARAANLMAQPFDARSARSTGEAFPIAENLQYDPNYSRGVFSVSETGILAYQKGSGPGGSSLVWFDRAGKELETLGETLPARGVALSPDGRRAATAIYDYRGGNQDLWIYDVAHGVKTRFTFGPTRDLDPVWSPDGSRIVYASTSIQGTQGDLYQRAASGGGGEEVVLKSDRRKIPTDWSPDGRFLVFDLDGLKTKVDIWIVPLFGERKPFPFLQTEFNEGQAKFLPDGRWLAYSSTESGGSEIYVAAFPGPGGKWQISSTGGFLPRWRRDGKELFYVTPKFDLMAVPVTAGETLVIGRPTALFNMGNMALSLGYDVSSDGQRFLVNTRRPETSAPITLVVNWTADLKK